LATTHFNDPDKVLEAQAMVDEQKTMFGIETDKMELSMQERGADI
ncbi:MAG: pyridoxal 5'-phosphate synthase lyase subunit PdxS, partial [Candidatus Heimdallarchaeota archaeon]|nr:pyridoxal 5'-phosphate synthase lyase subunit PdxS [Candidatus Heimdallarchaeota archaeon]